MKNKLIKILGIIFLVSSNLNCKEEVNIETNKYESQNNSKFNTTNTSRTSAKDSIELTSLIRKVYKWHETNFLTDFPYKHQNDSIFIGINWEEYDKNIKHHKGTNLFTEEFFIKHKNIALIIDQSIKNADIEWRNSNDGIPLWHSNADDWCACQDNPNDYWKILTIDSLKINDDLVSFYWTWDKKDVKNKHQYLVTAKKVNKIWKINSLEWQNYNYSVEKFDKMMND